MSLPANVGFCTVVGRFIRAVADTNDPGRDPDGVPISGLTVTFTSTLKPPVVRNQAATPPTTIIIDPITCTTDAAGVLLGPDNTPGVVLVASNDEDLEPYGWTYEVRVSGPSFPALSFSFVAPVDGTVDLSTVVPVPPNPGAQISAWQAAVVRAEAARDEVLQALEDFEPGGTFEGTTDDLQVGATNLFVSPTEKATIETLPATLAGKADASQVVPVTRTVAGKPLSANVTLAKGDVGLGNVDNTADSAKTFGAAQVTSGTFAESRIPTLPQSKVSGLTTALGAKIGTSTGVTGVNVVDSEDDLPVPSPAIAGTIWHVLEESS